MIPYIKVCFEKSIRMDFTRKLPILVFLDTKENFKNSIEKSFHGVPDVVARIGRFESVPREDTAFVSPANCRLFFDGGLDYTLSRVMFPGMEADVNKALYETHCRFPDAGNVSLLGRPYLGLGSTILLRVQPAFNSYVLVSPTMLMPQDVSATQNAYTAMLAILRACQSHNQARNRIPFRFCIIPALCCGYGKMNVEDAARQCRRAYDEFVKETMPEPSHTVTTSEWTSILYPCLLDSQPKYYENSEFFHIRAEDIIKKRSNNSTPSPRVYLAGPECFSLDSTQMYDRLKVCCVQNGLTPVVPLQEDDPVFQLPIADRARGIAHACTKVLKSCDAILANVSPFRGLYADPGTCVELGFAAALEKPIFIWSYDLRPLIERMQAAGLSVDFSAAETNPTDPFGSWVENIGCSDNSMLFGLSQETFARPEDAIEGIRKTLVEKTRKVDVGM